MNLRISKPKKEILSWSVFISMSVICLVLFLLFIFNAAKWCDYPNYGFAFRTARGIHILGMVNDQGYSSGFRVGDKILNVNGKSYSSMNEIRSIMNREIGQDNVYIVDRGGQKFQIRHKNVALGLENVFERCGYEAIFFVSLIVMGSVVFLMKKHDRMSWIFYIFVFTFGLFSLFLETIGTTIPPWLEHITVLLIVVVPAVFVHLALCFPEEIDIVKKHPFLQIIPYLLSFMLVILTMGFNVVDLPSLLRSTIALYLAAGIIWFLLSNLLNLIRSKSDIARSRSKVILMGFALASIVPLLDFLSLALFGSNPIMEFKFYFLFFSFFPLSVGYAIIKHNLFDIDAFIRRSYGYLLTTGALAILYGGTVLASQFAFGRFDIMNNTAFIFLIVLGLVFLFNPIRIYMQRFIDRSFYRLDYDYQELVKKISESMASLKSLNEVTATMINMALGSMFVDNGGVILLNRKTKAFEYFIHDNQTKHMGETPGNNATLPTSTNNAAVILLDDPFIRKVEEKKSPISIYDIQEDPFFHEYKEHVLNIFEKLQAIIIVPLIYENRLIGFIFLGRKKSGKFYQKVDINLLNTLANQGAVAIENSILLEGVIEKERMKEELAIAHNIQTSMLPTEHPRITGFDLAAISIPAREVGGDFYDFIEMEGGNLGVVIGDVSGKGVSSALVMSAIRSIFRMLSEDEINTGQILKRANKRVSKDIKKGIFVAAIYAVLESNSNVIRLCSAGQTLPIYLDGATGESRFIETIGDNFPLGIVDSANYEEIRIELKSKDKILFFTDGVVEAMNDKKELFGFDRILELSSNLRFHSSREILEYLSRKVEDFVGSAPQHDDLTLIVITSK